MKIPATTTMKTFTTISTLLVVVLLAGCSNLDPRGIEVYRASVQRIEFQDDGATTKTVSLSEQYRAGPSPFFTDIRFETGLNKATAGREAGTFLGKLSSGFFTVLAWLFPIRGGG